MTVHEADLKRRILKDLQKTKMTVIDMGMGTFDLYVDIESGRGYFIELKIANKNFKPFAKVKGIKLTNQTSAIRRMENLPIVFACDDNDKDIAYLILPEQLKRLVQKKKRERAILTSVKYLEEKGKSYNDALSELVSYLSARCIGKCNSLAFA